MGETCRFLDEDNRSAGRRQRKSKKNLFFLEIPPQEFVYVKGGARALKRQAPMKHSADANPEGSAVRAVLALLLHAHERARRLGGETAEFAIPVAALRAVGVADDDIALLCGAGLVEHFLTGGSDRKAIVHAAANTSLSEQSRFFLSQEGLAHARRPESPVRMPRARLLKPRWQAERRSLWLGRLLVKRFPHSARCQELILASFQEQDWAIRIDSPLPQNGDGYERLRNAVKKLNCHQQNPLICFGLDGSGEGIVWKPNTGPHPPG
jgi:hypothetical protein